MDSIQLLFIPNDLYKILFTKFNSNFISFATLFLFKELLYLFAFSRYNYVPFSSYFIKTTFTCIENYFACCFLIEENQRNCQPTAFDFSRTSYQKYFLELSHSKPDNSNIQVYQQETLHHRQIVIFGVVKYLFSDYLDIIKVSANVIISIQYSQSVFTFEVKLLITKCNYVTILCLASKMRVKTYHE